MLIKWSCKGSENHKLRLFQTLTVGDDLYQYNQLLNEKNNTNISWDDRGTKEVFWELMEQWYNDMLKFYYGVYFFTDSELDERFDKFYNKINNFIETDQEYTGDEVWKEIENLIF